MISSFLMWTIKKKKTSIGVEDVYTFSNGDKVELDDVFSHLPR